MTEASNRSELAADTPSETFSKTAIFWNLHWHLRKQLPSLGYLGLSAT